MGKAMKLYLETLELDPSNNYAVLGLANIMAEHGKVADAQQIYKALKDQSEMHHVYVNQAVLMVA